MAAALNLFSLVLLVILFVEARDAASQMKELDDEQTAREDFRKKLMDEGKWTDELEQEHVNLFRATARAMFQPWCSPNSFKFAIIGAVATFFMGQTCLPGVVAGACIASPRVDGYFIRAMHIISGKAQ